MPKTSPITVANLLDRAIRASGKTQREIAREVGYARPNFVSMLKAGDGRLPLGKMPAFAKALNLDTGLLLRLALAEYEPTLYEILKATLGTPLSENERALLDACRAAASAGEVEITPGRMAAILRALGEDEDHDQKAVNSPVDVRR